MYKCTLSWSAAGSWPQLTIGHFKQDVAIGLRFTFSMHTIVLSTWAQCLFSTHAQPKSAGVDDASLMHSSVLYPWALWFLFRMAIVSVCVSAWLMMTSGAGVTTHHWCTYTSYSSVPDVFSWGIYAVVIFSCLHPLMWWGTSGLQDASDHCLWCTRSRCKLTLYRNTCFPPWLVTCGTYDT